MVLTHYMDFDGFLVQWYYSESNTVNLASHQVGSACIALNILYIFHRSMLLRCCSSMHDSVHAGTVVVDLVPRV